SPYGKELRRWLRHGIGVHHAGLLPKYRILVEQLAQKGLLKLICGTDTLGVGINVPIRTVLFTQLWKYDGKKAAILSVRDFRQISGRAGRKGYDDKGYVIIQAPEHVVENKRAEEKAAGDPKKKKKLVKQSAPDGAVVWDAKTFERLRTAPPEELSSQFGVSHGMLLLVLSRDTDGCRAMQRIIRESHETEHRKRALRKRGWQLFRALVDRKIVEILPRSEWLRLPRSTGAAADSNPAAVPQHVRDPERSDGESKDHRLEAGATANPAAAQQTWGAEPGERERQSPFAGETPALPGPKLRVNVELQDDFSLHQALSLYLIDTLPLLNRESPDHPFDVLTLCEAIVEDPDAILRRQVDKLKTEKLEEMRAAGIAYEERMEKLEQIEHPKPLREFLYDTFNTFAAAHPWVEQENVRPKSIAREMFERYLSFAEYVREYGLQRSEGLLLRHLSQVYKVLAQTVPATAKTDEVAEMEDYFRELIRGIDSSLLEEWERLRNPEFLASGDAGDKPARPATFDITRDTVAFRRLVRTAIFGFLQDVAVRDWESAVTRLQTSEAGATAEATALSPEAKRIEAAFAPYFAARGRFRLDPEGRSAKHTHWSEVQTTDDRGQTTEGGKSWSVAQVLIDPEEMNDWEARFVVPLSESRAANRAVVRCDGVSPIGGEPSAP
ncbi:MAG: DUF3516 domain-containing protein, partial [Opitutaceae bacterium]|nr:DUF3516 domain-containing protein [Opitutaceae bacterium]